MRRNIPYTSAPNGAFLSSKLYTGKRKDRKLFNRQRAAVYFARCRFLVSPHLNSCNTSLWLESATISSTRGNVEEINPSQVSIHQASRWITFCCPSSPGSLSSDNSSPRFLIGVPAYDADPAWSLKFRCSSSRGDITNDPAKVNQSIATRTLAFVPVFVCLPSFSYLNHNVETTGSSY